MRGRPRKEDKMESKHEQTLKNIKEDESNKKNFEIIDSWYELSGEKVLSVFKKRNGNILRTFAFMKSKHPDQLRKLQNENKLKIRV